MMSFFIGHTTLPCHDVQMSAFFSRSQETEIKACPQHVLQAMAKIVNIRRNYEGVNGIKCLRRTAAGKVFPACGSYLVLASPCGRSMRTPDESRYPTGAGSRASRARLRCRSSFRSTAFFFRSPPAISCISSWACRTSSIWATRRIRGERCCMMVCDIDSFARHRLIDEQRRTKLLPNIMVLIRMCTTNP